MRQFLRFFRCGNYLGCGGRKTPPPPPTPLMLRLAFRCPRLDGRSSSLATARSIAMDAASLARTHTHLAQIQPLYRIRDCILEYALPLDAVVIVCRHPTLAKFVVPQGQLQHDAANAPNVHQQPVVTAPVQNHFRCEEPRRPAEFAKPLVVFLDILAAQTKIANFQHAYVDRLPGLCMQ